MSQINNTRSRCWCFTINNYTPDEYQHVTNIECEYLVVGKEKGALGTDHLQGYIYFKNQRRFNAVKTLISNRCHLETAIGTPEQNRTYCTKEGDYFEKGTLPKQGKRSDLEEAADLILKGKKVYDLAMDHPGLVARNFKGLQYLEDQTIVHNPIRRTTPRQTYWIYGDSEKGKTRLAIDRLLQLETAMMTSIYDWPKSKDFIDNYHGEKLAIFDDFRPSGSMDFDIFLRITDPWINPTINVKGGTSRWIVDVIYFTSISQPVPLWLNAKPNLAGEQQRQIKRRITEINILDAMHTVNPDNDDETQPTQDETSHFSLQL
ncbi:uncharacterized protein MONOS_1166c6 [Monocercomonoides exilis]|uniref:uncharacterized protein n=1 Tax=Monocercomonoides exilis TaxID=2049356 RepID=UPI0035599D3F|nr:hypothetical protein MONOS_1166c1 [Monocercomonoides exilis]KAH7821975.1 hypothetical protein MONOS_1166c2 [Monocercomonoides exilis]KAH7821977.1 hypothetical protein MONOS_1166c3 [Monocercomonoides exilis]KAH7821979.1 hypothetical protein MONOS_1166c4 [Monocercomonoides exilis]KAH7821981.1 hypothetical protein MONOS_1166c5 [Monocercomonoides exilis]|eukprot:MONOS_1166.1-p1 / transcript=MONOS_1166.1 / gene=MONOS_1166 / organism=Monocercomonoides_exilis_PA203 / gene_product=replication-associated protein / transcript_product=replication-associated protein / location=Mono_scaffold00020:1205-2158(-) / protein_length=317 / sequence_SO=supercontig / SO=protein_coding / is_pseudo=false